MRKDQRLHGEALRQAAAPVRSHLATPDQARLDQLLDLAQTDTEIELSVGLEKLFPEKPEVEAAQGALRGFRERFNALAEDLKLSIRFKADTNERSDPAQRRCWFEGEDPAFAGATRFGEELTADLEGRVIVPPQGRIASGSSLAAGKSVIRCFVSYANTNLKQAKLLKELLEVEFGASKRYQLENWWDRDILAGEDWRQEILKALDNCDFGLLLVSPEFLGSKFIAQHELPAFVQHKKPILPVGLIPVDFHRHDLKGLGEKQIFRLAMERDPNAKKYFSELSTDAKRRKFARDLFVGVETRLDKLLAPPPQSTTAIGRDETRRVIRVSERATVTDEARLCSWDLELKDRIPVPGGVSNFQPTRGVHATLDQLERANLDQALAKDALDVISEWCRDPDPKAPPFFALLGEYGIGKTTTLRHLTRRLLEERKQDPALPLPIYIDLRDYLGDDRGGVPTIEDLLQSVIVRAWKVAEKSVTAGDLLRLVREEGAVIFFDGLDEKIVHLTPDRARAFIRTLWSVLPDATRRQPSDTAARRGKLLISCRSHYFRDIASQNAMLVGEDREGIRRADYPAFCLLPFTEDQILRYLTSFLGDEQKSRETVELIGRIHNLRDLAQRPYLLSFIAERLGDLEALHLEGGTVNAATLYQRITAGWLNRDDGKHQIDPSHKRVLMEELAAALWRDGAKSWAVDRLETWFDEFLAARPAIAGAYPDKNRSVLKEDLRTATFVLRPDTEQNQFRFAHTSLQEYFLACHLQRALREGRLEAWELPRASTETLDFLGQLLAADPPRDRDQSLEALNRLLGGASGLGGEQGFRYWLQAREQAFPEPTPTHVNLAGLDLEETTIRGRSDRPFPLQGSNLQGTRLNRSRWEHVDLTGANLTDLEARQALFLDVRADGVHANGVDFRALQWRGGCFHPVTTGGARLAGCQWIDVALETTSLPAGWERDASIACPDQAPESLRLAQTPLHAQAQDSRWWPQVGHSGGVNSCAWSPDGQRILSGADDGTLMVWDAQSGRALLTLKGHQDAVRSCAWSPDGQRILSGADDNTLRVWDARSGRALLTLQGHQGRVWSCAWSPDGQRILSGADDNTLRVWDAPSGLALLTLKGHQDAVRSCAWSPDGQRILSGADDNTLKVWDAPSGRALLTLQGHQRGVNSCAWSPDGRRILSGAYDNTLRVWDASTGRSLLTLQRHQGAVFSCAWSPDGQRILSGAGDGTLKVWDAPTGRSLLTLQGHQGAVFSCAWSPDGQRILSGADDKTLKAWDAPSGRSLLTLQGHHGGVRSCAWSADGQRILSGAGDGKLKAWDALSGRALLTLQGHQGWVMSCAWSPDGQRILSGAGDGKLKVWDASSGRALLTLQGHQSWVMSCAWSPDGQRILSGADDKTLKVWDARSGRALLTLQGHHGGVRSCAWSADGRRILSGADDNTLKIWDADTGQCLRTMMYLPEGQVASWTENEPSTRVLHASPEAWRFLGWRWRDPETGHDRILPAEMFGPLPMSP